MKGFLEEIAALCLIRLAVEMILPESNNRRFAELGVGLMLMIAMLRTLEDLLRGRL